MNLWKRITLPYRRRLWRKSMIEDTKYYPAYCPCCGWAGPSHALREDRGFDDSDIYCPDCNYNDPQEA